MAAKRPTNRAGSANPTPYKMNLSRMTADKLGVKLYDKASAVVAELIANAYDADATVALVEVPLATKLDSKTKAPAGGYTIRVVDNGHGMTPKELQAYYLNVGQERRNIPGLGERSRKKKRFVMGRKGVGKLAPFGICRTIEVRSAGGKRTKKGYQVAHVLLHYDDLLQETTEPYLPEVGKDDGSWDKKKGTVVTLRDFNPHTVPDRETFFRQLAARFGLELSDWKIMVKDTRKKSKAFKVGELDIPIMEGTRIEVDNRPVPMTNAKGKPAGKLNVRGWVAYAKQSYRNPEVAGVRIYAHGKIVAATRDFEVRSGFTGEFTIRSYVVGAIHADWLDKEEDLIKTDRQDILWDTVRTRAFQAWGAELLKELGKVARQPARQKAAEVFMERSGLQELARQRYADPDLQKTVLEVGRLMSRGSNLDDLEDQEHVERMSELCLTIAPHKALVDSLARAAVDDQPVHLAGFLQNLMKARVAEDASLGQVARLRIDRIRELSEAVDKGAKELVLQKILEKAPWLIDPQWTALTMNQTFTTVLDEFPRWHKKTFDEEVVVRADDFQEGEARQRPDFVMLHAHSGLVLVELKAPGHRIQDDEFDRLVAYRNRLVQFLESHEAFKRNFPNDVKIVLVCDDYKLGPAMNEALKGLKGKGLLHNPKWVEFKAAAKNAHEDFLTRLEPAA